MTSSPKEFREFALDCGKQAAETTNERLREVLLETARQWMEAAQHLEKSWVSEDDKPPRRRPRCA